jgi:hypothetical protein
MGDSELCRSECKVWSSKLLLVQVIQGAVTSGLRSYGLLGGATSPVARLPPNSQREPARALHKRRDHGAILRQTIRRTCLPQTDPAILGA